MVRSNLKTIFHIIKLILPRQKCDNVIHHQLLVWVSEMVESTQVKDLHKSRTEDQHKYLSGSHGDLKLHNLL